MTLYYNENISGYIWVTNIKFKFAFEKIVRILPITYMAQPVFLLGSLTFGDHGENETMSQRIRLLSPTVIIVISVSSARPQRLGVAANRAVPEGWPHRQRLPERCCFLWYLNCNGCSRTHKQNGSNHTGTIPCLPHLDR